MIIVVRMGHRKERDKRVTTHCALVARAFGADKIIITGESDLKITESVKKVVAKWGGNFKVENYTGWKPLLKKLKKTHVLVHLTFYGEKMQVALQKLKTAKNVAVIIGAEKMPREVYNITDYNISIGSQPHSEIAALAVFLYGLLGSRPLYASQKKAMLAIQPSERGKKVTVNKPKRGKPVRIMKTVAA